MASAAPEWSAETTVERYLASPATAHWSRSTRALYTQHLRLMCEFLRSCRSEPATAPEQWVRGWISSTDTTGSQHVRLTTARHFYRWVQAQGLRASDPTEGLFYRKRPPQPEGPTDAELGRLLAAIDPQAHQGLCRAAMLALVCQAGLTTSEVVGLPLAGFDPAAGTLEVPPVRVRQRPRSVVLSPLVCALLVWYLQRDRACVVFRRGLTPNRGLLFLTSAGQGYTRTGFWEMVRTAAERAGLEPSRVSPESIRRGVGNRMLALGATRQAVQAMLGGTPRRAAAGRG